MGRPGTLVLYLRKDGRDERRENKRTVVPNAEREGRE